VLTLSVARCSAISHSTIAFTVVNAQQGKKRKNGLFLCRERSNVLVF